MNCDLKNDVNQTNLKKVYDLMSFEDVNNVFRNTKNDADLMTEFC